MIATTVVSISTTSVYPANVFPSFAPREIGDPGLTAAVIPVAVVGTIGLGIFPQSVLQFLGGIQWDGAFVQTGPPQ